MGASAAGPDRQQQLRRILGTFGPGGGVVSADALAGMMCHRHDQPLSMVARWVLKRSIVSFEWQGQLLVPLFQIDRLTMLPTSDLLEVLRELIDVFDEWDTALWFATSNSFLAGDTPATRWDVDPQEVVKAARADRYVARG